jgi:hypothetical protein
MRETTVVLDSENAFANGVRAAVADKHKVIRVRISPPLRHAMLFYENLTRVEVDNNPVLKNFFYLFDPVSRKDAGAAAPCGWLYGAEVFADDKLTGYSLVIESQPIPADKLA